MERNYNNDAKAILTPPELDDIDPDSRDDPDVDQSLDAVLARLHKIELFLVDFGWGE